MTPANSFAARLGSTARRLRTAMLACVGIALFLGFVALGTWQVERRAWKHALITRVEQRVHVPPQPLLPASQWPQVNAADHEYLPVTVQGRWLANKTVLTQAVTELGAALQMKNPEAWLKRADDLLGRLAYPIFITHFLVFFCSEKLLRMPPVQGGPRSALVVVASSDAAAIALPTRGFSLMSGPFSP